MMFHIKNALQNTADILSPLEREIILSHILKKSREYLLAHPDAKVPFWKRRRFFRLVKHRAQGIPLAYLTGHKEFFALDFLVNKHTLIPRPETELLVDETVKEMKKLGNKEITFIEVGTGSGCIPIAVMKTIDTSQHINIHTYATDISQPAVRVAKKNAQKHGVVITFIHGDLLSPIRKLKIENCTLIITANLPYLTQEQFTAEPTIRHEPPSALVAHDYGLALYKKLLQQLQQLNIDHWSLIIEIDPSQSSALVSYIRPLFPAATIEIKKDLSGNDRVACMRC